MMQYAMQRPSRESAQSAEDEGNAGQRNSPQATLVVPDRRTDRRRRGDEAEAQAVEYLKATGYEILDRNVACKMGEIDIVAKKDGILCFVEVRMRSSAVWGDPSMTISWAKQRRVVRAAYYYLRLTKTPECMLRFDVMSVLGSGLQAHVEHIPNAFDAGF